jgi:hypothetical protein
MLANAGTVRVSSWWALQILNSKNEKGVYSVLKFVWEIITGLLEIIFNSWIGAVIIIAVIVAIVKIVIARKQAEKYMKDKARREVDSERFDRVIAEVTQRPVEEITAERIAARNAIGAEWAARNASANETAHTRTSLSDAVISAANMSVIGDMVADGDVSDAVRYAQNWGEFGGSGFVDHTMSSIAIEEIRKAAANGGVYAAANGGVYAAANEAKRWSQTENLSIYDIEELTKDI